MSSGCRGYVRSIAACNRAHCVYIGLLCRVRGHQFSLWRIAKDGGHRAPASLVISDMYLPCPTIMHVAANHRLAFSRKLCKTYTPIVTCEPNGSMQRVVQPSTGISSLWDLAPKSNGNHILLSGQPAKLLEIDMGDVILRQYIIVMAMERV